MATTRFVERDDALTADRREDRLVRPDRPQVLSKVFGSCRETGGEGNESTHRSDPQEPASTERKHRKISLQASTQDDLEPERRVSRILAKSAVVFATPQLWVLPHITLS
jgi:hypothetical protein